jgi:hypothetical protein
MDEVLLNDVIRQIQDDIADGDLQAIEELLRNIPEKTLRAFLPVDN